MNPEYIIPLSIFFVILVCGLFFAYFALKEDISLTERRRRKVAQWETQHIPVVEEEEKEPPQWLT